MLYYFYNNTSNFNFIDNNFFWRNCFINRVFLNLEELLFRSCIINNCDNFRFCIITTRCITKPTIVQFFTHELFVRASFLLSIDFFTRKSKRRTRLETQAACKNCKKWNTKKSIRNQGDGSIFHNHCNIECM